MLRYAVTRKGWQELVGSVIYLAEDVTEAQGYIVLDTEPLQVDADLKGYKFKLERPSPIRVSEGHLQQMRATATIYAGGDHAQQVIQRFEYEILFLGLQLRAKLLNLLEGVPSVADYGRVKAEREE